MVNKVQLHLIINEYLNKVLEDLSNTLGRTKSDLVKEAIILLGSKYDYFLTKKENPETKIIKAIRKLDRNF